MQYKLGKYFEKNSNLTLEISTQITTGAQQKPTPQSHVFWKHVQYVDRVAKWGTAILGLGETSCLFRVCKQTVEWGPDAVCCPLFVGGLEC